VTARQLHVASVVPVAFLAVALGAHPVVAVPLLAGALLPDLDAVSERIHRSWALHTFLVPAVAYQLGVRFGAFEAVPALLDLVHFLTLGMALHFVLDFIYPRRMSHDGAAWPVRPVGPASHWGLLWLGLAWAGQWLFYLAPAFLPWLVGA
jgi:hypothetical protein